MTLSNLLSSLEQKLSPGAEILIDSSSAKFKAVLQRWSDIDVKVPGAILRPTTKSDTVNIIKAAHEYGIPFVPASGGHSPWSTIDSSGFILDLGLCKSITVEAETESVRVTGAVLIKELTTALPSTNTSLVATGNGNTVGVIPFCLGGGISTLTGMIGFGCDQILSADIVLADGTLVHTSADQEPDLLWAVKGAGQFFGVVVELRLKTYPLSVFGSRQGTHWVGNLVYPLDFAEEVCKVLERVMVTKEHNTAGIVMVMAPPPAFQPMIAVSPHFIGDPALAPLAFQSLLDLKPLMYNTSTPIYPNLSDHLDFACAKGDYKRFSLAGLPSFNAQNFMKVIELYKDLLATCPDAGATGYAFEWHTGVNKLPVADSAFGNEDSMLWLNTFSWYHSAENHDLVLDFENRAIAAMRVGIEESEFVDYANCNRIDPIERRYRGKERLERLRMLKKKWDPNGVFTKQLL
ncbi:FAD binding domain containing protein [Rutstroemia sp. NJR-2017a BBW]|nr:FAD binding domain containing protein [Rutstroemia sp. NJR-2017a BBW]